jgi:predicted porin
MPKKRQNRLSGIGFEFANAGSIDQGRQRVMLLRARRSVVCSYIK